MLAASWRPGMLSWHLDSSWSESLARVYNCVTWRAGDCIWAHLQTRLLKTIFVGDKPIGFVMETISGEIETIGKCWHLSFW